jgi:hypothetical protein
VRRRKPPGASGRPHLTLGQDRPLVGWEQVLLDAYGIEPDAERTRYYRLVWELGWRPAARSVHGSCRTSLARVLTFACRRP